MEISIENMHTDVRECRVKGSFKQRESLGKAKPGSDSDLFRAEFETLDLGYCNPFLFSLICR